MDTAEELRMNLASLQRIDPYIVSIKESASQVNSSVIDQNIRRIYSMSNET
jgi:hypothetical protein